jgi:hypothetical protein
VQFVTIVLAITGAAILGVLPAIKATGINVQAQLRHLAAGSTLRLGGVWTTAMIAQVAMTVICTRRPWASGKKPGAIAESGRNFPDTSTSPGA